ERAHGAEICALRLRARERARRARRRSQGVGRERGRQGILSRHRRGPAQIVSRRQALPAAQALAGLVRRKVHGAMRSDHYDQLETRDPRERERDAFARLPNLVARALSAPGWAAQLAGIDPNAVSSRAALARLPLLRKSELTARQRQHPPFGGFNVTAPRELPRL